MVMWKPKLILGLTAALFFIHLTIPNSSTVLAASGRGAIPGRFIIKVHPDARISLMKQATASVGSLQPLFPGPMKPGEEQVSRYYVFSAIQPDATAASVSTSLGNDNIELIEQDQYVELYGWPSDPLLSDQWYLWNHGQTYRGTDPVMGSVYRTGIAGNDVHISTYYDNPPAETSKVVVGIIDTGEDLKHPDLIGRLWHNPGEIPDNGRDDDHNGYVDDTVGYDLSGNTLSILEITGDNDPTDTIGHGTHVAGIVAAENDGHGVVGIAPWASIMPVKIWPNAYWSIGARGIIYAVDAGAQVINISWGSPFESMVIKDALAYARSRGVFVAVAAGNSGDGTRGYPAAMDSVFAVGAGDSRGYMTGFSTYGPFVDIVAPGQDILSLRAAGTDMYGDLGQPEFHIVGPDRLYYLANGTSMASPMVAGAAALIWSFRPDLSLDRLESILKAGAIDMIDPRNNGSVLPGHDTISGYGYLCVECSLDLLGQGGIAIASPRPRSRCSGAVSVRGTNIGSYNGNWKLEYAIGPEATDWQLLSEGDSYPSDSVLGVFNHPDMNCALNLRVTDEFGTSNVVRISYVNSDEVRILSPLPGDTLRSSVPIKAVVCGPDYDSAAVSIRNPGGGLERTFSGSNDCLGSELCRWNASGSLSGNYRILVRGYFGTGVRTDSVAIHVESPFAAGWPQTVPTWVGQSVVAADLNHDDIKEVILGTINGLYVFEADGQLLPNFPIHATEDMRSMPAICDVDGDGVDEIICTSAQGLHAITIAGDEAAGFPIACALGTTTLGYPTPTIASLGAPRHKTIMVIDTISQILAYNLDGSPYLHGSGGVFGEFLPIAYGAHELYEVAAADILGRGSSQVIACYRGYQYLAGIGIYDGATGKPILDSADPRIWSGYDVYGVVMGDLTGDSIPELVISGQDTISLVVTVLTRSPDGKSLVELPGWPKRAPEFATGVGNIPTLGDLDEDGIPEIIFSYYLLDFGSLYAFRADGSPYRTIPGRPVGELFTYSGEFQSPLVVNITGDHRPEIIFRTGYIFPYSGTEKLVIVNNNGELLPGYPMETPAPNDKVGYFGFMPLVDDIDGDGKVDLVFSGLGKQIDIWNFDAPYENGRNRAQVWSDNEHSHMYRSSRIPTGVDDGQTSVPGTFALAQNYPNPFNPSTTIEYSVPSGTHVSIDIFNVLGQRIKVLVDQAQPVGTYRVDWRGTDEAGRTVASGIYFYRLKTDAHTEAKKMILLK
jgi:subtilisin family serine protease